MIIQQRFACGLTGSHFLFSLVWLSLPTAVHAQVESKPQPNVLIVMTDDQGYGDMSSHGNPHVRTPNLDRFAESGARFERFFVSPVCAPTRASLLTGRYHLRTGVSGVTRGYENLRSEEITIAELFRDTGYSTGCFGKWHNGRHMPMHPNGQGFETFIGFCAGHWNTYFDPPLEHNGEPIQREGYIADVITDSAIEFMANNKDQPWLCYVAYNTPHSPWRVPEPYWSNYNGLGLDTKAQCAYAMVENIDDNFQRLLQEVDRQGKENTIVLFLTDNGANSPRFNAGMKGRKASIDEGGTRVPLFIRYPGTIKKQTKVEPIAFHLDILPTLTEYCGVKISNDLKNRLDGQSLVPLLSGQSKSNWSKRMLFTHAYRSSRPDSLRAAIRTDRYRATVQNRRWRLYDMIEDPGQTKDIAKSNKEILEELKTAFAEWRDSIDYDSLANIDIPIGHPSREQFVLPANEATLTPGYGDQIRYTGDTTSGYANSWITGWTSTEAFPQWQIDVHEADDYLVSFQYTVRREDVGCQLKVEIGDQSEVVNIPQAFDPPLLPKPDYLYSTNYQDKESWADIVVGSFSLKPGRHALTVRLTSIARERGIDLKSVTLRRLPTSKK